MASVLVIDDESTIRALVRRILSSARYSVTEAADGRDGLEYLAAERPAVVITDIFMPNMEGLETIREIRRRSPDTKILAISGSDFSPKYLGTAQLFGADAVLRKPFRAAELLETVNRLAAS